MLVLHKIKQAHGFLKMAHSTAETKGKLSSCWQTDVDWKLYPSKVKEVSCMLAVNCCINCYRH